MGNEPDAQVIIWDFASKEIVRVIDFPQELGSYTGVQRVEISPDSKLLGVSVPRSVSSVSARMETGEARVIFVDVASGETTRQINGLINPSSYFIAPFSNDWDYIVRTSKNNIKVIQVSTGTELRSISLETKEFYTFSLINNALIEDSQRNMIRVWDIENGLLLAKLFPAPDFSITTVSPDGKWIVSAVQGDHYDCRSKCMVRVWNLEKYYP